MWFGFIWIVVAAALPVQVTPASGDSFAASLVGFENGAWKLEVSGQSRLMPLEELSRLERSESAGITEPSMSAALRGGSRLKIEGLRITGDTATLLMRRQEALEIPVKQLDWVRFRPSNAATDPDWLGIVGRQQVDDILVIRRSANAIDQAPGIVTGADADKVDFDLGGSSVPAPIAKLEGIVFANRSPEEPRGTTVTDVLGSQWAVESLAAGSDQTSVTMILEGSVRRELKLEQIRSIRFADGATLAAGLEPLASEYTPLIQSPVDPTLLAMWLGPKSDNGRDLVLRSRSSMTFRVDPEWAAFVALVIPDRRVEAGSGAIVRVRLGEEIAWEQLIVPGNDAKGIELDVGDASRVTLEVDFGDDAARGDAGDVIRFIEPRFLK